MDEVLETLGCEPVPWTFKTDCCGASLALTEQGIVDDLVTRILTDAKAEFEAWRKAPPTDILCSDTEKALWRQSEAVLRMAQKRLKARDLVEACLDRMAGMLEDEAARHDRTKLKTTQYGVCRTRSVNWPPPSKPT